MNFSDPTPDTCPRCGELPAVETYMDNSREIDALTGDLIEYEVTEYRCCGYAANCLEDWNGSAAADTIAQQAEEIERLKDKIAWATNIINGSVNLLEEEE